MLHDQLTLVGTVQTGRLRLTNLPNGNARDSKLLGGLAHAQISEHTHWRSANQLKKARHEG
jgi:hypothetical protein